MGGVSIQQLSACAAPKALVFSPATIYKANDLPILLRWKMLN
jgi:hypothetical protein